MDLEDRHVDTAEEGAWGRAEKVDSVHNGRVWSGRRVGALHPAGALGSALCEGLGVGPGASTRRKLGGGGKQEEAPEGGGVWPMLFAVPQTLTQLCKAIIL